MDQTIWSNISVYILQMDYVYAHTPPKLRSVWNTIFHYVLSAKRTYILYYKKFSSTLRIYIDGIVRKIDIERLFDTPFIGHIFDCSQDNMIH